MDPRLVNTTPGFEDLHLLPDSPAIDRGVAGPNAGLDIDGDQRPSGSGIDWGADEIMQPEIAVEYNATMLTHLGQVDVGLVPANGGTRQFVIHNVERGPLYLGSPPLTLTPGTNCAAGTSVLTLPPGVVAPNSSEVFTIRIVPTAAGAFDLTIDIDSSDRATPRFTFTVTGTGVAPNLPAVVAPAAGSSFTGPAGGPLRVFVNPGAALVNAQIAITDPEGDLITVHSLVPVSVPPTGVTAPAAPAPAIQHLLDWAGVVAATSAPGDHTWRLEVSDAVNGARVVVSVIVHVVNLPPAHAPVAGQTGSGTPGAPYFGEFTQGEDVNVWADLALLTDPNLSQNVDIAAVQQGVAPSNGAFTFAAQAGTLRVRPSGQLTAQDRGTHRYTVQVTDGAHVVAAEVELFVWGATGAIQFLQSTLPPGEPGKLYAHQIAVTGATGGVVYSVVNGALPAWLALDTATGALSGTPHAAGQWSFTIRAIDNTQDTASQPFELTVATPPPPAGTTSSGSAGCVAGLAPWPWFLVMAAFAFRRRRGMAFQAM